MCFKYLTILSLVLSCVSCFHIDPSGRSRQFQSSLRESPPSQVTDYPRTQQEAPCYWKPDGVGGRWQRRIHIEDLHVGQKLKGVMIQQFLNGKTGPKLFYDVGVGRTDASGQWCIVNGMMRLDRAKESVTNKRVARLRKKKNMELYVSRIQPECSRLELCQKEEQLQKFESKNRIPVTSLSIDQEVTGTVVQLRPYGAMVDVGANRLGLLHIQRVADLYGKYIDKVEGLAKAGLERGANIRLRVESLEGRRLSLDFTKDVKADSIEGQQEKLRTEEEVSENVQTALSEEELAAWAEFASIDSTSAVADTTDGAKEEGDYVEDESEDDDDDSYDNYDEERDIEDSLGLGFY